MVCADIDYYGAVAAIILAIHHLFAHRTGSVEGTDLASQSFGYWGFPDGQHALARAIHQAVEKPYFQPCATAAGAFVDCVIGLRQVPGAQRGGRADGTNQGRGRVSHARWLDGNPAMIAKCCIVGDLAKT